MKKITILTLILAFATASFSQQIVPKKSLTQTDYLQKSKKLKKVGSILLIGGAGLIIAALVIPKGELVHDGICIGWYCSDKYKNDGIKSASFIAGGISALGSIPFFIASGKKRRKANAISASVFINAESKQLLQGLTIRKRSFPAIGMRINL